MKIKGEMLSLGGNSMLWLKLKKISKIRWNKNQERELAIFTPEFLYIEINEKIDACYIQ